jgi:hypothetical protein
MYPERVIFRLGNFRDSVTNGEVCFEVDGRRNESGAFVRSQKTNIDTFENNTSPVRMYEYILYINEGFANISR